MTIPELYLPADRYAFAASQITNLLQHRLPANPDDAHIAVHTQLRASGIDMGEPVLATPRVNPSCRLELIEALIALQPSPITGQIDNSDVRLTLGEVGNVWPSSVREATSTEIVP